MNQQVLGEGIRLARHFNIEAGHTGGDSVLVARFLDVVVVVVVVDVSPRSRRYGRCAVEFLMC